MARLVHTPGFGFTCIYTVAHRDPHAALWVSHSLFHQPSTDGHGGDLWFYVVTVCTGKAGDFEAISYFNDSIHRAVLTWAGEDATAKVASLGLA